jgi:hypothetical protein
MADQEHAQERAESADRPAEDTPANGGTRRKTAVRAAVIAAASGATALAAKKALSGGSTHSRSRRAGRGGDEHDASLVGSLVASGWDAAKDSLLPVAEDAASAAGEYVARSAPDIVRERIVPRFISGFERTRGRASHDGS